ncbi:MAG: hypothetical protein RLZ10_1388 [Bacteroidota bacterium]
MEIVGYVGVDSGQVMIVDPCYLREWEDNEFDYQTGIKNKKTGEIIYCFQEVEGVGKIRWDTPLPKHDNKCMNQLAEDKENWEKYEIYPDKGGFNYSGVCGMTCSETAGEIAIGGSSCVASSTYLGDGSYPVYAEKDKYGRVKRLIIDFYGEEESDEDDE